MNKNQISIVLSIVNAVFLLFINHLNFLSVQYYNYFLRVIDLKESVLAIHLKDTINESQKDEQKAM